MNLRTVLLAFCAVCSFAFLTNGQVHDMSISVDPSKVPAGTSAVAIAFLEDTIAEQTLPFDDSRYEQITWTLVSSGDADRIAGTTRGDSIVIEAGTTAYRYIQLRAQYNSISAQAVIPVSPGPAYAISLERDSSISGTEEHAPDSTFSTYTVTSPDTTDSSFVFAFVRDQYGNILDEGRSELAGNVEIPMRAHRAEWKIVDASAREHLSMTPYDTSTSDTSLRWIGVIKRKTDVSAQTKLVVTQNGLQPDTIDLNVTVGSEGPQISQAVLSSPVYPRQDAYDTLVITFETPIQWPRGGNADEVADRLDAMFCLYDVDTKQCSEHFFDNAEITVTSPGESSSELTISLPHTYAREGIDIRRDSLRLRTSGNPLKDKKGAFVSTAGGKPIQGAVKCEVHLVESPANPAQQITALPVSLPGGTINLPADPVSERTEIPEKGIVMQVYSTADLDKSAVTIYDMVGNVIADKLKLYRTTSTGKYVVIWDGYNTRYRRVASGTYLSIIRIKSASGKSITKRKKIALVNSSDE